MKIRIVAVGTVKSPLAAAVRSYEERAGRYWKLEVDEVAAGAGGGTPGAEAVRAAEGARLSNQLSEDRGIWALTRKGKGITSRGLARYLERLAVSSHPGITFLVGGAFGLDRGIVEQADRALSLSAMTLPHELALLVLLEQLYRAGTIRRGEPYHKGP